ncbi:hypothetical protein NS206_16385 [Microbacterium testaceum]|uniref:hypothetical protein n=1 Tax=Microbacterium testaceum TaxID=2033 RepID=UPI000733E86A|nr:hypothetical protein [Microbacterium testaceum]KTS55488.1 hypothetical protein NS206_16385 [Microbacterium testaceum]
MPFPPGSLTPAPDREPDLHDDFRTGLDPRWWVASYLPHWTTPERARARYDTGPDGLALRIDRDQPDWREEDAPLRVSNLQTGVFSGPVGSPLGSHRHREGLTVRTETPTRLLFAPSSGRVEITVSASRDVNCMTAAWLVGTEHRSPTESGEICIFEIDADAIGETTVARSGIKAHHDPHLTSDMSEVALPLDASAPHTWFVQWGSGETVIGCQDRTLRRVAQAPDYPLFLMIDLFEIGPRRGLYPKTATIHRVRAWGESGLAAG